MKKLFAMLLIFALCVSLAPSMAEAVTQIALSDTGIMVDGQPASSDPRAAVYTANDIVFYLEGQGFTYGEGTAADEHPQAEADAHTVVHITRPGTYELTGTLSAGQIAVEIPKAKNDEDAVVTLILNNMDLTCTVAPAVIFYNVYECGDKDEEKATKDVDTSRAGANVIIADGSVNHVRGSYVARIYEPGTVELNKKGTKVKDAEKLHKYDAAFYSKRSMNIFGGEKGDGVLNITAQNEGLGSELHLTLNGGIVNITSGNDGINTNEDNVSVTTVNGGELNITVAGWTGEGDGIDSNGWLVINGGRVTASACGVSMDAGIDSDMGIYLGGGSVSASGSMLDHIAGGESDYAVFSFREKQAGGGVYTLKNEAGETVAQWSPVNDFTSLVVCDPAITPGRYTLWAGETQLGFTASDVMMFGPHHGGMPPQPPEGMDFPNPPKDRPEPPKGFGPGGPRGFEDAGEWNGAFEIIEGGNTFGGVKAE